MDNQIRDCFYCSLPTATIREHFGIRIALCETCNRYVLRVVEGKRKAVRA